MGASRTGVDERTPEARTCVFVAHVLRWRIREYAGGTGQIYI